MMYLESTNGYRRAHEVYDLKFSQDLANDAQAYAVQMQALYDSTDDIGLAFMHSDASTRPEQGENLGYYEAFPPNPALISETTYMNDEFYDEVDDYNFADPANSAPGKMIGHFTAMVWRDSCEMGCGVTENFLVCRYSEPGNVRLNGTFDLYLENVCPLGEKCYVE